MADVAHIDIALRQGNTYNALIEENPTFVGISEGALRPVIREQDLDIRATVLQKIRSGVTKGHPMEAENIDLYDIALKTYC